MNKNKEKNISEILPKGVFKATKKNGQIYYRSSFTYKNKHISLGSFELPQTAHKAYMEACGLIKNASLTVESYNSHCTLSFYKWISIINLRDNGYYFKTPIYMKKNYFLYYLSENNILKFDVDDLFFYSTHTIMQRNGHLFVADYGMQINIKNRYGIKNFAILGKDYIFANGDETDFRYGNIIIFNKYNGVTSGIIKSKMVYTTKIHIIGDYIVGKYDSETDAAIAYNKAADILLKKGLSIKFSTNYVEGITSMEYASRYNKIKISKKILEYVPK